MSIYAEKRKGRLTGVFIVEVEEDGKRLRARAKSMDEAREIERAMERGRWKPSVSQEPQDDRLTIGALYTIACLNGWKDGQANKVKSFREVEWCLEVIGRDVPVDALNVNHFKQIKEAKRQAGCTLQTGDRYMAVLSSLVTWGRKNVNAKGQPYTTNSPAVPYSGIVRERTEWFTAADQERLIQRMVSNGHMVEATCALAYGQTGMRARELLSLKADQVGIDTITLLDQKNGTWGEGIPVQPEVARALRRIIEQGLMPSYDQMLDRFKKAAAQEGFKVNERLPQVKGGGTNRKRRSTLDTVGLHTLRHSTATRLILDGENPAVVQEFMRHSSWATTRKYLKLTGAPKRLAMERIALSGGMQGIIGANPLINNDQVRGSAGDFLRGKIADSVSIVSQVCDGPLKIREEIQGSGSLSRTRTCDHSINSESARPEDINENK